MTLVKENVLGLIDDDERKEILKTKKIKTDGTIHQEIFSGERLNQTDKYNMFCKYVELNSYKDIELGWSNSSFDSWQEYVDNKANSCLFNADLKNDQRKNIKDQIRKNLKKRDLLDKVDGLNSKIMIEADTITE